MNTETKPLDTPEGREWIQSMLKMGPVRITFNKSDGTERVMNCTLQEEVLPKLEKKTDRQKKVSPEVLPVFDLDVKAWRSFKYSSVTRVEFSL